MLNLPINTYGFVFFVILFIFSLAFVVMYLILDRLSRGTPLSGVIDAFSGSTGKKVDEEMVKQEVYKKAAETLEDARIRSLKIIGLAHVRAKKILSEADMLNERTKKVLEEELRRISQKQVEAIEGTSSSLVADFKQAVEAEKSRSVETIAAVKDKGVETIEETKTRTVETLEQARERSVETLEKAREKSVEAISEASNTLRQRLLSSVGEIKGELKRETIESEKELKQRVSDEYLKLKGELDEYRSTKLQEIDAQIYEMLGRITKEILGKVLTIDDQEDLVLRVLDEAKREGEFGV